MQETWVWSLGWEDPLEEGLATHSSILAWRFPWTVEPGGYSACGHKELDMSELLNTWKNNLLMSWCSFFSYQRWHRSTGLHFEQLLQPSCATLQSGPMPQKLICCCSVAQPCPILWDPMDCSTPGFPIHHHLPVCSDSCLLSQWCHSTILSSVAPSPALNLSQNQHLYNELTLLIKCPLK